MTNTLGRGPNHRWQLDADHVDMSDAGRPPRRLTFAAQPQKLTLDLRRTALVIIDLQNDFCAEGGMADERGRHLPTGRAPVEPLNRLTPVLRELEVPVIWLNWGNRPDQANLPPNQLRIFKPTGEGLGLGDPLPANGSPVLQKGSWGAAIYSGLKVSERDLHVDKYRLSGFWDTPLDSILRNLGVRTLLFAGVNIDQCVLCTLADASFLGYGCVLLEDCCATASPQFCTDATLWNVQKCFGFTSKSDAVLAGLAEIAGLPS